MSAGREGGPARPLAFGLPASTLWENKVLVCGTRPDSPRRVAQYIMLIGFCANVVININYYCFMRGNS